MEWIASDRFDDQCAVHTEQASLRRRGPSPTASHLHFPQLKSVIRRTKETTNVHPMYREGLIRRKLGPGIFHKSNSQDRLIEELQGKLGIVRPEPRRRKQPDDWMTEGVIVMSNPQRTREQGATAVDKVAQAVASSQIG